MEQYYGGYAAIEPDRWRCCRCGRENERDERRCETIRSGGGLNVNIGMLGLGGSKESRKCNHLNCSSCLRGWVTGGGMAGMGAMRGMPVAAPPAFLEQQRVPPGYARGNPPTPYTFKVIDPPPELLYGYQDDEEEDEEEEYDYPHSAVPVMGKPVPSSPFTAEDYERSQEVLLRMFQEMDVDQRPPTKGSLPKAATPKAGTPKAATPKAVTSKAGSSKAPAAQAVPNKATASPSTRVAKPTIPAAQSKASPQLARAGEGRSASAGACDGQEAEFEKLMRKPLSRKVMDEWHAYLLKFVATYHPMRDEIINNPAWISEKVTLAIQNAVTGVVNYRGDSSELAVLMWKTFAIVIRQQRNAAFIDLDAFTENVVEVIETWPDDPEVATSVFWAVRNTTAAIAANLNRLDYQAISNVLIPTIQRHHQSPKVISEASMSIFNMTSQGEGPKKIRQQWLAILRELRGRPYLQAAQGQIDTAIKGLCASSHP